MVHALAAAITDVTAATAKILTPRQRCIAPGWLHQERASSKLRTPREDRAEKRKTSSRIVSSFLGGGVCTARAYCGIQQEFYDLFVSEPLGGSADFRILRCTVRG